MHRSFVGPGWVFSARAELYSKVLILDGYTIVMSLSLVLFADLHIHITYE